MFRNTINKIANFSVTQNNQHLINKIIFYNFCNHFKKVPLVELQNDKLFIQWVYKSIHEEPSYEARAFQLCLEIIYRQKVFEQNTVESIFEKYITLQDAFYSNKGLCEQSTVYSCTLAVKVATNLNLSPDNITVNSTPFLLRKDQITYEMRQTMEENKTLTGNSAPDLTINKRPYDFKDSKDISWNKNHVYLLDIENITQKGYTILNNLESSLKNQTETSSSKLSPESILYAKSILAILKNRNKSPLEILEKINQFTIINQPPRDFRIPYIIPTKKASLSELKKTISEEEIATVNLEPGHLTDVKARKAIQSIQEKWDPELKEKVRQAVTNSISHILLKTETNHDTIFNN